MAESIENQQQIEAESGKVHRSRSGFWIGVIIFLAVALLFAGGFFLMKELRDEQKDLAAESNQSDQQVLNLSNQITGFQQQIAAMQKQIATQEEQLASKEERFNKIVMDFSKVHQEKSDTLRTDLTAAVNQIQRQLGKTRGDWLLADAEYLLSIASQRLHLTGDVETTREALTAADERLRESGDAAAFKVREELAQEIAALDKVKVADIVGIYSAIQMLYGQVDSLTTLLPFAGKEINKPQTEQEHSEAGHSMLDSALVELEGLITVRHSDQPVESILTPEQAYFIKEQLRVKLEMLKIALVQQNQALYKANLADARQWIKAKFTMNDNAVSFIEQLDKLDAIQIHSQLPDISKSLKMLRNITKLRLESDKALPSSSSPQQQTPPPPAAPKAPETPPQASPNPDQKAPEAQQKAPAAPAEQH